MAVQTDPHLSLVRPGDTAISETIWDSPKTLAASRSVAARVRIETVKSTGCVIRSCFALLWSWSCPV
jgi:hypothetical protein